MPTERERRFVGPRRGQLIFAIAFLAFAALLLSQIGSQTQWVNGTRLEAQPRFWPAIGLGLMTVMGALYLWRLPWKRFTREDWAEARKWGQVVEYVLWFLAYVLVVPVIGYLPSTLIFTVALAWRLGYRSKAMIWITLAFGLSVVLLFKTFLSVKIPGGALYDYLPGALRGFFILNL